MKTSRYFLFHIPPKSGKRPVLSSQWGTIPSAPAFCCEKQLSYSFKINDLGLLRPLPLNKFVPCCGPFIFIRETGLSRLRQRYTVLFYKEGEREQNSAFCGPRGQLRRRRRTVRRAFQHPYEHHPKRFLLRLLMP